METRLPAAPSAMARHASLRRSSTGLRWLTTAAAATAAGLPGLSEAAPLPAWQPGPAQYLVTVDDPDSAAQKKTVSLYPPGQIVPVNIGSWLGAKLRKSAHAWTLVELYDSACPHCWYAAPVVTNVAKAFQGTSLQLATLNCHAEENGHACIFLEILTTASDYPTFILCPPEEEQTHGIGSAVTTRAHALLAELEPALREKLRPLARCTLRRETLPPPSAGTPGESPPAGFAAGPPLLSSEALAEWIIGSTDIQPTDRAALSVGVDFAGVLDDGAVNAGDPPGEPGWERDENQIGIPRWLPEQRWHDAMVGFADVLYHEYRVHHHHLAVRCLRFLAKSFPLVPGSHLDSWGLNRLADQLEAIPSVAAPNESEPGWVGQSQSQLPHEQARSIIFRWAEAAGLVSSHRQLLTGTSADRVAGTFRGYTTSPGLIDDKHDLESVTFGAQNRTGMPCRGTACQIWTLLHTTLAAIAARAMMRRPLFGEPVSESTSDPLITPKEAMQFTAEFVEAFLSCRQCKRNFIQSFHRCEYLRCMVVQDGWPASMADFERDASYQRLNLWLWRVHNAVSLQVARERGAGIDRRWPMYLDCQKCWKASLVTNGDWTDTELRRRQLSPAEYPEVDRFNTAAEPTAEELNKPFNLANVFIFLLQTYIGADKLDILAVNHHFPWNEARLTEAKATPAPSGSGSVRNSAGTPAQPNAARPPVSPTYRPPPVTHHQDPGAFWNVPDEDTGYQQHAQPQQEEREDHVVEPDGGEDGDMGLAPRLFLGGLIIFAIYGMCVIMRSPQSSESRAAGSRLIEEDRDARTMDDGIFEERELRERGREGLLASSGPRASAEDDDDDMGAE